MLPCVCVCVWVCVCVGVSERLVGLQLRAPNSARCNEYNQHHTVASATPQASFKAITDAPWLVLNPLWDPSSSKARPAE